MCSTLISLAGVPILFSLSPAFAVPKGPKGQTCKSHGTKIVDGKEEGTDKAMKCTADYCTYDECEPSGSGVGKCYEKTSYSNVRDCKAAAQHSKRKNLGAINPNLPGQNAPVAPAPLSPRQQQQRLQMQKKQPTVQYRGVEGEPVTSTPTDQKESATVPK
jgi:hypothetical protein